MDELALTNKLKSLEVSWASLDLWLKFWILLVVIGVSVELVVILVEYFHELHDFSRGIVQPPEKPNVWLLVFALLGAGLVAIGVAGEFFIHIKAGRIETEMRDATGSLVALVEAKAEEAGNEAAALLLENTRLEAIIQPRSLSLNNQRKLASECSSFRDHAVMVKSYAMDAEAYELGAQIIAALNAVKIPVADARASFLSTGPFETGIHVRGKDAELDTASCLAKALRTIGKLKVELNDEPPPFRGAGMGGGGQVFNPGVPFTTVMIGVKPLPTLTPTPSTTSK
jgi:hypothetical protein